MKPKILSLDGGGFRGLSSLIMLRTIFNTFKYELEPPQPDLRPCEFFDLIAGTSTGGIIALMLGRLRMSIDECIEVYSDLGQEIFGEKQGFPHKELFDTTKFEHVLQNIVERKTDRKDTALFDSVSSERCKVAVFTLNQYNIDSSEPEILRSYNVRSLVSDGMESWTIWEAARATSAAPTFFKPLSRGKPPRAVSWYDAGMGHNNPAFIVRDEAGRIWGKFGKMEWQKDLGLFLSLGTGVPAILRMEKKTIVQELSAAIQQPLQLVDYMKQMLTDTEKVANKMNDEFGSPRGSQVYFRFNVEQGLSAMELFDFEKEEQIRSDTKTYMDTRKAEVNRCAALMVDLSAAEADSNARLKVPATHATERDQTDLRTKLEQSIECLQPFQHFRDAVSKQRLLGNGAVDHWVLHTNAFDRWKTQDHQSALGCAGILGISDALAILTAVSLHLKPVCHPGHISESDRKLEDQIMRNRAQLRRAWIFCSPSWRLAHIFPVLSEEFSGLMTEMMWQIIAQLINIDPVHGAEFLRSFVDITSDESSRRIGVPRDLKAYKPNLDVTLVLNECHKMTAEDMLSFKELYTSLECISRVLFLGFQLDDHFFTRQHINVVTESTEREECLQSLFFAQVHARRDEVAVAIGNTTNWIVDHKVYQKWLKEDASFLWIQGKPGSGKSVLAKRIVAEAIKSQSSAYSKPSVVADWFYSVRGGATGMSHTSMLRSILYEMLKQNPVSYRDFRPIYRLSRKRFSKSLSWSDKDLLRLLEHVACDGQETPLVVILDGLDECQDAKNNTKQGSEILDTLMTLVRAKASRLKTIVLSRPHVWIEKKLLKGCVITMQQENTSDIEEIIALRLGLLRQHIFESDSEASDEELPRLSRGSPRVTSLEDKTMSTFQSRKQHDFLLSCKGSASELESLLGEIHHSLTNRASGVILWVILVLEELLKIALHPWRPDDMRKKLYDLPSELDELYEQIVKDIIYANSNTPAQIDLAQRCLTWVIGVTDFTPLRLFEMREAIAIPDNLDEALKSPNDPIIGNRYNSTWLKFRQLIYSICGPLLEVQTQSDRSRISPLSSLKTRPEDIVILVHQTARDFLARQNAARRLHVDPNIAKGFVNGGLKRYVDIVFPRSSTAWATSNLFPHENYVESVPRAVQYVNERSLLSYCHHTTKLRNYNGTSDVQGHLLRPRYSETDIVSLLIIEPSTNSFWQHSLSISKDLRNVAQAWKACQEYLQAGEAELRIANELLKNFIRPGLSLVRGLYWYHICVRIQQLLWHRWFTSAGLNKLAARIVQGRTSPSDRSFVLVPSASCWNSDVLLVKDLSLQLALEASDLIDHPSDAVLALVEMMHVARSSFHGEVIVQIKTTLHAGRAAILRWAWQRDGTPYMIQTGSMELEKLQVTSARGFAMRDLLGHSYTSEKWPRQTPSPELADNRFELFHHNCLFHLKALQETHRCFIICCAAMCFSVPSNVEDHTRVFTKFLEYLATRRRDTSPQENQRATRSASMGARRNWDTTLRGVRLLMNSRMSTKDATS